MRLLIMEKEIMKSKYKGLFLSLFEESNTLIKVNKFWSDGFIYKADTKDKPFCFF